MNTIFKIKFFAIASIFAMCFVASSCVDSNEQVDIPKNTLYEEIVKDKDLTDFVEVLDACDLSSSEIGVVDSLFNTSRVYSVWAPVNGSFNKDSIIKRVETGFREDVMKTFVGSHVANFLKPAKGDFGKDGEFVLMLNEKKLIFAGSYQDGYTFAGKRLCSVNNRVKNGIIHKLEAATEYEYNIWEYLRIYSQTAQKYKVDSLVNYLYSYNDTTFSEYLSIPGPIVDKKETYLDSVFVFENKLLTKYGGVGNIDVEDSLYTFYMPTDDAWNKMIAQAKKHFSYVFTPTITDTVLVDSLKEYYPKYNITKYLTYSENEQTAGEDSIVPAQEEYPRKRFSRKQIEKNVVETKELSNGTLKVVNKFPYSIFDLWHDTIRIEAEALSYVNKDQTENVDAISKYTVYDKDINKKAGNKLSGSQYIVLGDEVIKETDLWYYIPDVKSATYKVALITVPKNVKSDKVDLSSVRRTKLRCNIYSYDPVSGKNSYSLLEEKGIEPSIDKIDTLYLSNYVTFPICEYKVVKDVDDFTANIRIRGTQDDYEVWDNTIRLDAILLIPVEDAK